MPTRGPYAKTGPTREQALAAVLEVVAEHGLSSMSIQQIAEAVGLTKAGLLYHFGSREGLLLAVIERSEQLNGDVIAAPSIFEALIEIDEHNLQVPGLVELLLGLLGTAASESGDTVVRRAFKTRYAGFRALLVDNVRTLQAAGAMRDDLDPVEIATLMIAASDGVQAQRLIDDSVPAIPTLRALLKMLAPRRD